MSSHFRCDERQRQQLLDGKSIPPDGAFPPSAVQTPTVPAPFAKAKSRVCVARGGMKGKKNPVRGPESEISIHNYTLE